jgi:hypothetical protein
VCIAGLADGPGKTSVFQGPVIISAGSRKITGD